MISILGFVGSIIIRLLMMTARITIKDFEKVEEYHRRGENVIYSFWHGRMLTPVYTHRNKNIAIMVSRNIDGEYIAQVIRHMGFMPVRGSTSRGAVKATKEMLELSNKPIDLAITPDGPRGPKYIVQPGVIFLAQKTGRVIIPAGISIDRYWQMPSWDEFRIPKPFSRGIIVGGSPLTVPPEISPEEAEELRSGLEKEMQRITEISDNYFRKRQICERDNV